MRFGSFRKIRGKISRYSLSTNRPEKNIPPEVQQVLNSQEIIRFLEDENGKLIKKQPKKNSLNSINFRHEVQNLISFFLPKGYPSSIEKGYLQYSGYQFSGYLFSTAGSVLSTQSLLYALGLGDGSIPLAVTLNWIIKDGLGQFGGVVFASFVNNQFDQNPKRWRMISSMALDLSSFLELLTPLAPKYFLFLASLANIGKNISYLSASASRVAIHKSFTMHENLADVTAKTGSQTILSSLLGTSLGIYISTLVNHSYPLTSAAFLLCSAMHLSCTYLSLQSVTIRTLTHSKLQEVFGNYLNSLALENSRIPHSSPAGVPLIMTPQQFSSTEPILCHFPLSSSTRSNHSPIIIGADLSEIFPSLSDFQVSPTLLLPSSLLPTLIAPSIESSRPLLLSSFPRDHCLLFFLPSWVPPDPRHSL
jgi:hypothetical protein